MKKFALEIRTRELATNKICAWFCKFFDTEEALNEEVNYLWDLKEAYKNTHLTEIEFIGGQN